MPDPPAAREVPTLRGARVILRSGRPEDEGALGDDEWSETEARWTDGVLLDLLRGELLDA